MKNKWTYMTLIYVHQSSRWTAAHYKLAYPMYVSSDPQIPVMVVKQKTKSEFDKYKKASALFKEVSEKMSTMPDDIFNHIYSKIKIINYKIDCLASRNLADQLPDEVSAVELPNRNVNDKDDVYVEPLEMGQKTSVSIPQEKNSNSSNIDNLIANESVIANEANISAINTPPNVTTCTEVTINQIDFSTIKLPAKNIKIGRPRNEGITVIGLNKNRRTKKNIPFSSMSVNDQAKKIVFWLTDKEAEKVEGKYTLTVIH